MCSTVVRSCGAGVPHLPGANDIAVLWRSFLAFAAAPRSTAGGSQVQAPALPLRMHLCFHQYFVGTAVFRIARAVTLLALSVLCMHLAGTTRPNPIAKRFPLLRRSVPSKGPFVVAFSPRPHKLAWLGALG